jgi:hypothetical protein
MSSTCTIFIDGGNAKNDIFSGTATIDANGNRTTFPMTIKGAQLMTLGRGGVTVIFKDLRCLTELKSVFGVDDSTVMEHQKSGVFRVR